MRRMLRTHILHFALVNNMQGSLGPLDYDFTAEQQIISTIKSLKLNKANFGLVSNEILRCNPETFTLPLCLMLSDTLH